MKLSDWQFKHGVTGVTLAERVGVTQSAISKIARGETWPEAETIVAIEKATRGAVTASDILAEYQAAQRAKLARAKRRPSLSAAE